MNAQPTPGPWEVDTTRNDGEYGNNGPDTRSGFLSYVVMDANGRALFDTVNSDAIEVEEDGEGGAWDAVGEANMTLAAAAPELKASLLEVLELCAAGDVDENTEAMGWGDAIKRARAAIAKAGSAT